MALSLVAVVLLAGATLAPMQTAGRGTKATTPQTKAAPPKANAPAKAPQPKTPPANATSAPKIEGTWSGTWTPKDGAADGVTVEFKQDNTGVSGRFLSPTRTDFTKATYTSRTALLTIEGVDQKSNKHYRLDAKVDGNELKGTFAADEVKGDVRLVKWTYRP